MIEKLFLLKWLDKAPAWIGHIYSMFLVIIGWTIFAQTDMGQLIDYLKAMFGIGVCGVDSDFLYFLSTNAVLLVALVLCSIDHRIWLKTLWAKRVTNAEEEKAWNDGNIYNIGVNSVRYTIAKSVIMLVLLVLAFAFLVGDSYNPFLYFRF